MTTFDEREASFENKFAHDEKMKFEATARACKRVALWAAEILKMGKAEAETYAETLSARDATTAGHDEFLSQIRQDLVGQVPSEVIHQKMQDALAFAYEEIQSD